jgi:hypothetical protein
MAYAIQIAFAALLFEVETTVYSSEKNEFFNPTGYYGD